MNPELVEMPCSESHGAESAQLWRGASVHPLCHENTILRLFNLAQKVTVNTNACPCFS